MSTSVSKIVAERNRRVLLDLVLKPGNDICADCKARAPRWASHNLGIFICVNCASIHRKIGTHITKVKSITLDEWNKEQVEVMKENGNIKSNALYNPDEARHPPPANMIDSERDSELEKFIRSKYEFKRFMDRKSSSAAVSSTVVRSRPSPLTDSAQTERKASPGPPLPPKTPENLPKGLRYSSAIPSLPQNTFGPTRSVSQPLPSLVAPEKLATATPLKQPVTTQSTIEKLSGPVWEDLVLLQGPSQSSSLPLQYSPIASFPPQHSVTIRQPPATFTNAPNPFTRLSLGQGLATPPLTASQVPASAPAMQFPFTHPPPMSSPALHLSTANPFNQIQALPSPVAGLNSTGFPTNSNPFFPSMPMASLSAPATPSVQPIAALPTGTLFQTQSISYVPSQVSTAAPSTAPFAAAAAPTAPGVTLNPFASRGTHGQTSLPGNGTMNPFSAMQMQQTGQTRFPGASPQPAFATPTFADQQHQPMAMAHGFGAWPGPSAQGTF